MQHSNPNYLREIETKMLKNKLAIQGKPEKFEIF